MTKKIGIIGVGNMGQALARVIRHGHPDYELLFNRRHLDILDDLSQELQAEPVSVKDLLSRADLIILAIKPKQVVDFFKENESLIAAYPNKLWLSVVSGWSLNDLAKISPQTWIRLMPNTPVAVGQGMIAYCHPEHVSYGDLVEDLFKDAGLVEALSEDLFPSFTALAGCSPAFLYIIIEAMSDAGVYAGLGRDQAIRFAAQALAGAGAMVLESGLHPGQLKDQVTSPAGDTIKGVRNLEAKGLRSAIIEAIIAAQSIK
ncbi:pyrroline-5-carboxylate reductase [Eremococcus coleocola]|uniref:Pyrroline-5-carboxylate reductase n=1 Tax=Eremococcus coleocola ACS-139-V-Col8 TaxID=908337 RepID=E4KQ33_9LACT|nr:pyrroline-5-carboxylate reductase [Eremococcus coleocola]EFR31198.1 pyrroline-5-carboxylate reductase [Eremococcus coleocola ACS-139-V-Col8]